MRAMAKTLVSNSSAPTHDEISARAYEIYLREGCVGGRDLDNWLKAEAELRSGGNGSGNGNGLSAEITQPADGATETAKSIATPVTASATTPTTRATGVRKVAKR
jgi:hypothetical protein